MYASNDWSRLWEREQGEVYPVLDTTTAKVVFQKNRLQDHYGEYLQGEDDVHMIFEVQDSTGKTRFFKKEGYCSSYGDYTWDGPVTEVFPKVQTITTWE